MDTQKLIYFHYVAKYLNFSKAAAECHIAQTAMSRCIANLEDELGFRLFDRSHRKVVLTPAGKSFFEDTVGIVDKLYLARGRAKGISEKFEEFLSIGFGAYERTFLMRHVKSFREQNPHTIIKLYQLRSDDMVNQLLTEQCDIVYGPMNRLTGIKNTREILLNVSKCCLAASKESPFANLKSVKPSMLDGKTFVCPIENGSVLSEEFKRRCDKIGFTPGEVICTNTPEAMFTTVELNLAFAIVPDHLNLVSKRDLCMIKLDCKNPTYKEHLAVGLKTTENETANRFLDHIEKCVRAEKSGNAKA